MVPEFRGGYYERGRPYSSQGNYQLAIQDLSKFIELEPEYPGAYFQRGFIYNSLGNYELAVRDYNKCIELDPDDRYAYCNRGEVQLHLSEWDLARADLTVASDLGLDVVGSFRNDYIDVTDFVEKNGLTVPEDIAGMLGG